MAENEEIQDIVSELKKLAISFSVKKLRHIVQRSSEFRSLYRWYYQEV